MEKIKESLNIPQWRGATEKEKDKYRKIHDTWCTLLYTFEWGFIEKNPLSGPYDGRYIRYHQGDPFAPEGHPDNGVSLEELGLEIYNPNFYKILESLPPSEREDFEDRFSPKEDDITLFLYLAERGLNKLLNNLTKNRRQKWENTIIS